MLSETNTIPDVKERLENIYSYYGFANDDDFENSLEVVANDVKILLFWPKLGPAEYTRIQNKDKVDLLQTEEYLYWAEVYAICYDFLKFRIRVNGQLQNSADEYLSVEGYAYSTRSSTSVSPNDLALNSYKDKVLQFFKLAGYDIMALERTCTIFGVQPDPDEQICIIE